MKKIRKIIPFLLAAAVVSAVQIGGTHAMLTARSPTVTNHINIAGDGIKAALIEPEWDGIIGYDDSSGGMLPVYEYRDDGSGKTKPVYGYENGSYNLPVYNPRSASVGIRPETDAHSHTVKYGIDSARNMIPGSSADKDPEIVNTSEDKPVWAAIKITFVYAGADGNNTSRRGTPLDVSDMLELSRIIDIDYSSDETVSDWKRIDEEPDDSSDPSFKDVSQVFYYKQKLSPGEGTAPLFTRVKVKETASSADIDFLKTIGGFLIHVEGFVVQGNTMSDNYNEFEAWGMNDGVVFNGTPTKQKPLVFDDTGIIP